MTLEVSDQEKKVIVAYELSEECSDRASSPRKRAQLEKVSKPSTSPRKRQKQVVGDQEVHDLPQSKEDGTVVTYAIETESGNRKQSLKGRRPTGSPYPEEGEIVLAPHWRQMLQGSPSSTDSKSGGEKQVDSNDLSKNLTIEVESELVDVTEVPPSRDHPSKELCKSPKELYGPRKARTLLQALGELCPQSGEEDPPPGSDACSSEQADDGVDTCSDEQEMAIPASIIRRQTNDPQLREKIHKIETDWWAKQISRDVYNEERFKLYTEEEVKEAHIVWPREGEVSSPAGYREAELEYGNHLCFDGGPSWDDTLLEFAIPFVEDELAGDEEAAKKRLKDKIEEKFNDPESKTAEYKRWENIKEVETEYYNDKISRKEYNKRRFALYSEEERAERRIVWPHKESEECRSPAGYRDFIFEQFCRDEPDWQTCMAFHWPYGDQLLETFREEKPCELCIPLIEEHRVRVEQQEHERRIARQKADEEREARRKAQQEDKEREVRGDAFPCSVCNRKFKSAIAVRMHTAAKHVK